MSVHKTIMKSICSENCSYNLSYAFKMFEEHEFEFVDWEQDPETERPKTVTMRHSNDIVVKITANTFFGCKVDVLEDNYNILKG